MRSRSIGALVCLALLASPQLRPAAAADPPKRKPLSQEERTAVLGLIKAVDLAQQTDVTSGDQIGWDSHVFKSTAQTAYVPFRLTLGAPADGVKAAVMYVRAVSRHDGVRAADERSQVRDWLMRGNTVMPRPETVYVGPGEMPVGGPGMGSSRQSIQAVAEASAVLALQQRDAERQKAAADAARVKTETKARDPLLFPFEDYYVVDLKTARAVDPRSLERALALPPGEYDVYVAMIDRARLKTSSATILQHALTVPDFWNDQLALSSLILASDVRTLAAPLSPQQQIEHPYTFGRAEVLPLAAPVFTPADVLSVVYQICNYGAPDADLMAEYNFYRTDTGARTLFNRTPPQMFGDEDLPPPKAWETLAFATQAVSLQTFPPGRYELEVTVRDRLTRSSASRSVAFTVASAR
jgi:hypothetical protein